MAIVIHKEVLCEMCEAREPGDQTPPQWALIVAPKWNVNRWGEEKTDNHHVCDKCLQTLLDFIKLSKDRSEKTDQ